MRRLLALAVLLLAGPAAWAQTPPDGAAYPDPQCQKPNASIMRPDVHAGMGGGIDSGAIGSYNSRVKAFNRDNAAYNACMHAYIDTANRDVKAVQDKANADLKQVTERANASMKAIQDKIRQAVADANSVSAELEAQTAKLRK